MGRAFRLLSSPRISYLSVACGSLALCKAFDSYHRRKEYDTILSAASTAGSAAALAFSPSCCSGTDGSADTLASLVSATEDTASRDVPPCASVSDGSLVSTSREKCWQGISRETWRETLASAKAAADAAGVSERDLDPKQVVAAVAAAHVLSISHSDSRISSTVDFCKTKLTFPVHFLSAPFSAFPILQRSSTRTAHTGLSGVGDISAPTDSASERDSSPKTQSGSRAHFVEAAADATRLPGAAATGTPTVNNNNYSRLQATNALQRASSEISDDLSDVSRDRCSTRLCVGRVAGVQIVNRALRIVWPESVTSQRAGGLAPSQLCWSRPYIQWPGRYLRVTYQYFVESSAEKDRDPLDGHQDSRAGISERKNHCTEREGKADIRRDGDASMPALIQGEHQAYEWHKTSSTISQAKGEHTEKGWHGLTQWRVYRGRLRFREWATALTRKLSLSSCINVDTKCQADSSTGEWMPPLRICEMTVDLRLPRRGAPLIRSRRTPMGAPLPTSEFYSNSQEDDNIYVVRPPAQLSTADQLAVAAGKVAAEAETAKCVPIISVSAAKTEDTMAAAGVAAHSDALEGNTVSDGSNDEVSGGSVCTPVTSEKSRRVNGAPYVDSTCADYSKVKPLGCLAQAWQDIRPQQLVIVCYETGRPLQSVPLLVLTQCVRTTYNGLPVTGSLVRKKLDNTVMRTSAVACAEHDESRAATAPRDVTCAATTNGPDEKARLRHCKQPQLPYSGELIDLGGHTVQSDEASLLLGGAFLVSLGVLKLFLQKVVMRRFLA